nr:zona pellucida-binding protein, AWN-1=V1 fragment [swine, sperm, Peptide Partial, 8 aa] [Sus scrofa]
QTIIATEK